MTENDNLAHVCKYHDNESKKKKLSPREVTKRSFLHPRDPGNRHPLDILFIVADIVLLINLSHTFHCLTFSMRFKKKLIKLFWRVWKVRGKFQLVKGLGRITTCHCLKSTFITYHVAIYKRFNSILFLAVCQNGNWKLCFMFLFKQNHIL